MEQTRGGVAVTLSGLQDATAVAKNILESLAIFGVGVWTVFVYVIGRSVRPIISISPKLIESIPLGNGSSIAVVSVAVRNTGRILVNALACVCYVVPLDSAKEPPSVIQRLDPPTVPNDSDNCIALFNGLTVWEPDEETADQFALVVPDSALLKISVEFSGTYMFRKQSQTWASAAILRINYATLQSS